MVPIDFKLLYQFPETIIKWQCLATDSKGGDELQREKIGLMFLNFLPCYLKKIPRI